MPTILDITADLLAFLDLLNENDGELTIESNIALEQWFAEIGNAQEQKVDNYCALMRELELRAAVRNEEAERLLKRRQADMNTVKRLKDRLKEFLEITGQRKVETARYSVAIQNNGGLLPMELPEETACLPPEYIRFVPEPRTELIRKDLEANKVIPGCRLKPRGTHLRVR